MTTISCSDQVLQDMPGTVKTQIRRANLDRFAHWMRRKGLWREVGPAPAVLLPDNPFLIAVIDTDADNAGTSSQHEADFEFGSLDPDPLAL